MQHITIKEPKETFSKGFNLSFALFFKHKLDVKINKFLSVVFGD